MRRSITLLALLAGCLFGFGDIDAHRYIADIKYLSSKQLKGRASGVPRARQGCSISCQGVP